MQRINRSKAAVEDWVYYVGILFATAVSAAPHVGETEGLTEAVIKLKAPSLPHQMLQAHVTEHEAQSAQLRCWDVRQRRCRRRCVPVLLDYVRIIGSLSGSRTESHLSDAVHQHCCDALRTNNFDQALTGTIVNLLLTMFRVRHR